MRKWQPRFYVLKPQGQKDPQENRIELTAKLFTCAIVLSVIHLFTSMLDNK